MKRLLLLIVITMGSIGAASAQEPKLNNTAVTAPADSAKVQKVGKVGKWAKKQYYNSKLGQTIVMVKAVNMATKSVIGNHMNQPVKADSSAVVDTNRPIPNSL